LSVACCQCQTKGYLPGFDFSLFRNTPAALLARAVESEDTASIHKYVLANTSLLNYQEEKFGNSLLALAVVNNKKLSVSSLLDLGADPNLINRYGKSPFLCACAYQIELENPKEMLLKLLSHGADVNSTATDTTTDESGRRKNRPATALQLLCSFGTLETVKILVEHGASLVNYGKNDSAILSKATIAGNLEILKYLMIDKKAPIPDYVVIRQPGTRNARKMTITDILTESNFAAGAQNTEYLVPEILAYLKQQGKR
jgi:ankyrin repeat protein